MVRCAEDYQRWFPYSTRDEIPAFAQKALTQTWYYDTIVSTLGGSPWVFFALLSRRNRCVPNLEDHGGFSVVCHPEWSG